MKLRRCDKCGRETANGEWLHVEEDDGMLAPGESLDFCGWACLQSFAIKDRQHVIVWEYAAQSAEAVGLQRNGYLAELLELRRARAAK